jgi:hypothetical protein
VRSCRCALRRLGATVLARVCVGFARSWQLFPFRRCLLPR